MIGFKTLSGPTHPTILSFPHFCPSSSFPIFSKTMNHPAATHFPHTFTIAVQRRRITLIHPLNSRYCSKIHSQGEIVGVVEKGIFLSLSFIVEAIKKRCILSSIAEAIKKRI